MSSTGVQWECGSEMPMASLLKGCALRILRLNEDGGAQGQYNGEQY